MTRMSAGFEGGGKAVSESKQAAPPPRLTAPCLLAFGSSSLGRGGREGRRKAGSAGRGGGGGERDGEKGEKGERRGREGREKGEKERKRERAPGGRRR